MKKKILIVEDEFVVAHQLKHILEKAGYFIIDIAVSVAGALAVIETTLPGMVLLDIQLKGKLNGIDLAHKLNEMNIPFLYLSANSNESILEAAKRSRPYGFLVKPFREKDVTLALDIAWYRHEHSLEYQKNSENLLRKKLEEIKSGAGNAEKKLLSITSALQSHISFDYLEIGRYKSAKNTIQWWSFVRIGFNEYQIVTTKELLTITGVKTEELEKMRQEQQLEVRSEYYNGDQFLTFASRNLLKKLYANAFHLESSLVWPFLIDHGSPFVLTFYSKSKNTYSASHLEFLSTLQHEMADMITLIISQKSTEYHANEIFKNTQKDDNIFPGIIGKSPHLLSLLDNVKKVAVVDTSVLILGETGTGKEKIAYHIHQLSSRKNHPLIKVNCAALPASLIESELFGHEKGSFTGAESKKIGRFEQANCGSIFLDEIGEISMDIQVKLLRVLQEKEFERVGGSTTIKVDIRVIAATNKNLEREVAEGRFRIDLYYRLNIFPIVVPPLRKRPEDIPLLAKHFVKLYAEKYNRANMCISDYATRQLVQHQWPGNVRELENNMERTVVLATGDIIDNVLINTSFLNQKITDDNQVVKTIHDVEKEHIIFILDKCNYKVFGPGGAAELLNIPPTTLASKMKKLGIAKYS